MVRSRNFCWKHDIRSTEPRGQESRGSVVVRSGEVPSSLAGVVHKALK